MGGGTMGGEEDRAGVNPGAKEGKDQQRREVLRRVRQCEYVFMALCGLASLAELASLV